MSARKRSGLGEPARSCSPRQLPLLLLLLAAAATAAWMPSTSFPIPSKFPLGPSAAVCGSGETLRPAPPAGGTMKAAEEGKPRTRSFAPRVPWPSAPARRAPRPSLALLRGQAAGAGLRVQGGARASGRTAWHTL